jgi:hypothetical protein
MEVMNVRVRVCIRAEAPVYKLFLVHGMLWFHEIRQTVIRGWMQEDHGKSLYGVKFCQSRGLAQMQQMLFATVGGPRVMLDQIIRWHWL